MNNFKDEIFEIKKRENQAKNLSIINLAGRLFFEGRMVPSQAMVKEFNLKQRPYSLRIA